MDKFPSNSNLLFFKLPAVKDEYVVGIDAIVKKLNVTGSIKGKVGFKRADFADIVIR